MALLFPSAKINSALRSILNQLSFHVTQERLPVTDLKRERHYGLLSHRSGKSATTWIFTITNLKRIWRPTKKSNSVSLLITVLRILCCMRPHFSELLTISSWVPPAFGQVGTKDGIVEGVEVGRHTVVPLVVVVNLGDKKEEKGVSQNISAILSVGLQQNSQGGQCSI